MGEGAPVVVTAAAEGIVDEVVVRRLIRACGAAAGTVHGKNGKQRLRQGIHGYNNAARFGPWIVLVDLDREGDCAPPVRERWLPEPARLMCLRFAVRAVEAWLLGDRANVASFLRVVRSRVPERPEELDDPKVAMVDLARRSRSGEIRADMVPRPRSGRSVGPAYPSRLIEFAENHWNPIEAARRAASLGRAIECLKRIRDRFVSGVDGE